MGVETMWFVHSEKYGVYYRSGHRTRKEAIADHEQCIGEPWRVLRAQGDRVSRFELRPIKRDAAEQGKGEGC